MTHQDQIFDLQIQSRLKHEEVKPPASVWQNLLNAKGKRSELGSRKVKGKRPRVV